MNFARAQRAYLKEGLAKANDHDQSRSPTSKHCGACNWTLDRKELTSNAVITDADAREVMFHPADSFGTAAVRGCACLTHGLHYWEIEMVSKCFGTDMMVGICTGEFPYHSFLHKFVNLLGMDDNSWGISYLGRSQHNRQFRIYMPSFNQGDVIGVYLDMEKGTVLFAKNGQWYGPPLRGVRGKSVYPILSSTAKRTRMRLIRSISTVSSLQSICYSAVARAAEKGHLLVRDLALPNTVRTKLNEYFLL